MTAAPPGPGGSSPLSADPTGAPPGWYRRPAGVAEVLGVAIPLMISTGTLSLVLFADRTLLLWYDGAAMSASMAAGNLYWSLICLPMGIASMSGAFVAQYLGSGQPHRVGRLLWQAVWLAVAVSPLFLLVGWGASWIFRLTGQPDPLVPLETAYLQALLWGATGSVLEAALSGFFSGTERTRVVMWVSVGSALVNILLDWLLIFGPGPFPAMGIVGAGLASAASFWLKAITYAVLIARAPDEPLYQFHRGRVIDGPLMRRLLFFGFPAGLQQLTEAAAFTIIVLQIGTLGDLPLRATTMAINFNMVAFVPLIGVAIAASVLVGRHLTQTGPTLAARAALAALAIALLYASGWASLYVLAPRWLLSLYELGTPAEGSDQAIAMAEFLLQFVALYVVLDAVQLVLAGALRGAGDSWFVLLSTVTASGIAVTVGLLLEPDENRLQWWWWMITLWVWLLAVIMGGRFLQGRWRNMRMVEQT